MRAADIAEAARVLGGATGRRVHLRVVDEFRPNRVARCVVDDGGTVIVKVSDRAEGAFRDLSTIRDEVAALTLLQELDSVAAASLLGADVATGVLVLEDLGDGPSLASSLLEGDPAAAIEAAGASASALGALHAETVGRRERYDELRARTGQPPREPDRFTLRGIDIRTGLRELPTLLADKDLPPVRRCRGDLESVLDELDEPGDFLALSSGDPCPDNQRATLGGVRFFDFEAATFRHALVDAAHFVLPFPNCWCWRQLPTTLSDTMLAAHRARLATTCTQAEDAHRYDAALTRTSAAWIVWTLIRRLPHTDEPGPMRARTVTSAANFSRLATRTGELPALNDYCNALVDLLRERWPDTTAETYPALGGSPWTTPA